jgi:hypothetical protein
MDMNRVPSVSGMMERLVGLSRLSMQLEFESFQALPCGCVAGEYRALPWAFNVTRLEVKGPHCQRSEHAPDQVLDVEVTIQDEEEDEVEIGRYREQSC